MRHPNRLQPSHYLSTHIRFVREWNTQDAVAFSQLVDFTEIEKERARRAAKGLPKPSYTAFIIHAIAQALRDHPKMNRMVYRSLVGFRWAQFQHVDIAVAVEVIEDGLDVAYASMIRNADQLGLEGIAGVLRKLAKAPEDDPQLKRRKMLPAKMIAVLARITRLHPKLWVQFRGGACAVTSPAKYGIESIIVKSSWPLQFAFGRVKDRPMVIDGQCLPRRSSMLSLSWHRELTTGAVAAQFFEQIVQHLQNGGRPAHTSTDSKTPDSQPPPRPDTDPPS